MNILGVEISPAALLGRALGGWLGYALAFGAGVAVTWQVAAWEADSDRAERLAVYSDGLALINAANEAAAALAAEDARKALAAAEAAAAAERERAETLAGQIEAIKAIPEAENYKLGLETMKLLEGLM